MSGPSRVNPAFEAALERAAQAAAQRAEFFRAIKADEAEWADRDQAIANYRAEIAAVLGVVTRKIEAEIAEVARPITRRRVSIDHSAEIAEKARRRWEHSSAGMAARVAEVNAEAKREWQANEARWQAELAAAIAEVPVPYELKQFAQAEKDAHTRAVLLHLGHGGTLQNFRGGQV